MSWAPSVLATPAAPKPGQPQQAVTAAKRFVSGGSDNAIRIWGFDENAKKWVEEEEIKEHDNWVRDVAWAPNIGLPGMYIASASEVSGVGLGRPVQVGTAYLSTLTADPRTAQSKSTRVRRRTLRGRAPRCSPVRQPPRTRTSPPPCGVCPGASPATSSL